MVLQTKARAVCMLGFSPKLTAKVVKAFCLWVDCFTRISNSFLLRTNPEGLAVTNLVLQTGEVNSQVRKQRLETLGYL